MSDLGSFPSEGWSYVSGKAMVFAKFSTDSITIGSMRAPDSGIDVLVNIPADKAEELAAGILDNVRISPEALMDPESDILVKLRSVQYFHHPNSICGHAWKEITSLRSQVQTLQRAKSKDTKQQARTEKAEIQEDAIISEIREIAKHKFGGNYRTTSFRLDSETFAAFRKFCFDRDCTANATMEALIKIMLRTANVVSDENSGVPF
jgi:uncharacterized protein (DUF4415 family)